MIKLTFSDYAVSDMWLTILSNSIWFAYYFAQLITISNNLIAMTRRDFRTLKSRSYIRHPLNMHLGRATPATISKVNIHCKQWKCDKLVIVCIVSLFSWDSVAAVVVIL